MATIPALGLRCEEMLSTCAMWRAGVAQELREALCGHAKTINLRVHGDKHPLEYLKQAIENLDYEVAVHAIRR